MNVAMARLVKSQLVLLETTLVRGLEVATRPNRDDREEDLRALVLWLDRSEHRAEFRTLPAQLESGHETTEAMLDDLKRAFKPPEQVGKYPCYHPGTKQPGIKGKRRG